MRPKTPVTRRRVCVSEVRSDLAQTSLVLALASAVRTSSGTLAPTGRPAAGSDRRILMRPVSAIRADFDLRRTGDRGHPVRRRRSRVGFEDRRIVSAGAGVFQSTSRDG